MASVLLVGPTPLVVVAVLEAHVGPASLVAMVTQMVPVVRVIQVALVVVVLQVVLTQVAVAAEVVATEVEAEAVALFEAQGVSRMTNNIGRFLSEKKASFFGAPSWDLRLFGIYRTLSAMVGKMDPRKRV